MSAVTYGMEFLYLILIIFMMIYIFTIYSLIKRWDRLTDWAKAIYLVLLLTGIGPLPILIMLNLDIGMKVM